MDAKVYQRTIENVEVIDLRITPIVKTLALKTENGVIVAGTVLQRNSDGDCIPHAAYADLEMAGDVNDTNKAYTYAGAGFPGPVAPTTVVVTHGDQSLQDDGSGRLYGDGTGTVNYITGAVAVTFDAAPASDSGAPVVAARGVPMAVATRYANTELNDDDEAIDDVVTCLVFGCVVRDRVNVGGAALGNTDAELLAKANIHALY